MTPMVSSNGLADVLKANAYMFEHTPLHEQRLVCVVIVLTKVG
jgi:hypothetical protein